MVANFCLFTHSFGYFVRYAEAKEKVRAFYEDCCKDAGDDDDFFSAAGSLASTTYLSCGDECSSDVANFEDFVDEGEGEEFCFACPGEEDPPPPGALLGTRNRKVGCKVGFHSDFRSTCKEGRVNLG